MKHVLKRIKELGYSLELTDKAKDFLGDKGFDPQYGARPLNRAIQKYLEDPLAEEILNTNVKEGDHLIVDIDDEGTKLIIRSEHDQSEPAEEQSPQQSDN